MIRYVQFSFLWKNDEDRINCVLSQSFYKTGTKDSELGWLATWIASFWQCTDEALVQPNTMCSVCTVSAERVNAYATTKTISRQPRDRTPQQSRKRFQKQRSSLVRGSFTWKYEEKTICAYPKIAFSSIKMTKIQNKVFFRNTSANMSPYLLNNSSHQILRENHTALLHCAPLLLIPRSSKCCLPISLDCLTVQSFHNSTTNFRVHTSVTFLINSDERLLLMVFFLEHLKTSLFHWKQFGRCVISRPSHAFPLTQNILAHSALMLLGLKLRGYSVLFRKLWRNFFCFMSLTHAQSTSQNKSACFCLLHMRNVSISGFSKFRYKKLQLLLGKIRKAVSALIISFPFFHERPNPEL